MDFIDFMANVKKLAHNIKKLRKKIETEEATKHSFVMPFIQALGYNVFDPSEVVPEYHADVGTKRGEKVDYAIIRDKKPIIIFECKSSDSNLNETHKNQLFRYFHATDVRIAVLTNGIEYHFFSDLEKTNKMDSEPFMKFNLLTDLEEGDVCRVPTSLSIIHKLAKNHFEVDEIITLAHNTLFIRKIRSYIEEQFHSPSPEFVKFMASQVYDGVKHRAIMAQFEVITKESLANFIEGIEIRVQNKVMSLFQGEGMAILEQRNNEKYKINSNAMDGVETTEEELEGLYAVKSMLRPWISVNRISHRDNKSYFPIILDDNRYKTICRLYFNTSQKYLGVLNTQGEVIRYPINDVDDLYEFSVLLRDAAQRLDGGASARKKAS